MINRYIEDSVVIGYEYNHDEVIILFVKMNNQELTSRMKEEIIIHIKTQCSPRHIPYKIIQIQDIPYTINGKKVELAVKNIIEGNVIKNNEALANPEVLEQYKNLEDLKY